MISQPEWGIKAFQQEATISDSVTNGNKEWKTYPSLAQSDI